MKTRQDQEEESGIIVGYALIMFASVLGGIIIANYSNWLVGLAGGLIIFLMFVARIYYIHYVKN